MTAARVRFPSGGAFHRDLKERVAAHLAARGSTGRDAPRMYLKTAVMLGWLAASYLLLLLWADRPWELVVLAISAGLAMAGIGFNVQHDGGHGGTSRSRLVNGAMAATLDLIGGSSYVWSYKHNVIHHTYANIPHVDQDTDVGPWARLTPLHRRRGFHRFQHLYLWALYGLLPVKWHFIDDYENVLRGRIGGHAFPRPKGLALVGLLAGKLFFYGWAIALPLALHDPLAVLATYAIASFTLGVTLAVTFQLAHCLAEADFPAAEPKMPLGWAQHQVATTVDFARGSRLLSWYLGGLNFQVEHHLFPQVCHVHYRELAGVVERTCADHGVPYRAHGSALAALRSHYRWLKRMGAAA